MNNTFSNKIGTEVFARNMMEFNAEIPQNRFIDSDYQELMKKSLLKDHYCTYKEVYKKYKENNELIFDTK